MPFKSSVRGAYGPQGQKVIKGPLPPVWVTSGSLTAPLNGSAYSFQLVATDDSGDAPTYSLFSGSLPTGLTLSSSGLISGTPSGMSASQSFSFVARAADVNGNATNSGTLTMTASRSAQTFTNSLPTTFVVGDIVEFTNAGSSSFTMPGGANTIRVNVIGGGGGTLGDNGGWCSTSGGGGGGGAYATIVPVANQSYSYQVGSGGSASASGGGTQNSPGNSGGQSWFVNSSSLFGNGGGGGYWCMDDSNKWVSQVGSGGGWGSNIGTDRGGSNGGNGGRGGSAGSSSYPPTNGENSTYGGGGGAGGADDSMWTSAGARTGGTGAFGANGGNGSTYNTGNTATNGTRGGGGGGTISQYDTNGRNGGSGLVRLQVLS